MSYELLQQVRVLDPIANTDRIVDVLIGEAVVEAVAERLMEFPTRTQIRECSGLVLAPGLVDLYSHSGEPGFEDRETLLSLQQAGAAGGFTRLTLLPDTQPALDHPTAMAWIQAQLRQRSTPSEAQSAQPQIFQWGALTLGARGEQMTELAELAEAGIVGFADGYPIASSLLLRRLLEYGQPLGKPIALYCCDRGLGGNGVVREGAESIRLGLPGSSAMAETAPLSALLECVAQIETPVHIMRVSTARGVELIADAKARGLPITASTSWMHLLLDISAVQSYHPSLRLDPPLGNPSDRNALLQGVKTGVIDAIAIDHTPLTYEEKTVAFSEAPPGAIGLELALPLLWQNLVASGDWDALSLWRCLSTHPARCLGQSPPRLEIGQAAELTLFDPNQRWTVTPQTLKSRSSNTPWLEKEVQGRVIKIWGR